LKKYSPKKIGVGYGGFYKDVKGQTFNSFGTNNYDPLIAQKQSLTYANQGKKGLRKVDYNIMKARDEVMYQ
jgi:hypothetical protein